MQLLQLVYMLQMVTSGTWERCCKVHLFILTMPDYDPVEVKCPKAADRQRCTRQPSLSGQVSLAGAVPERQQRRRYDGREKW
jgi:hypothetical protein